MARSRYKLTAKFVTRSDLKSPSRHGDGNGLYLNVTKTGTRSWIAIYTRNGVRREMGLGSADVVTLAQAREKAQEVSVQLSTGLDPYEERERAKAQGTFYTIAMAYIDQQRVVWKSEQTAKMWIRILDKYAKPINSIQPANLTVAKVAACVNQIWLSKPRTAAILLQIIQRVYDHARVTGAAPISSSNPAAFKGTLEHLLPRQPRAKHHSSMDYKKVPEFMASLRKRNSQSSRALQFIILTGLRKMEALNAEWCEIDMDTATLTIPGHRMKAGREHTVALSNETMKILNVQHKLTGGEGIVFPSRITGKAITRRALDAYSGDTTVHGFRASLRQYLGAETATPREIAEEVLSHAIGSAVERAYKRHQSIEKCRVALDSWAAYLA